MISAKAFSPLLRANAQIHLQFNKQSREELLKEKSANFLAWQIPSHLAATFSHSQRAPQNAACQKRLRGKIGINDFLNIFHGYLFTDSKSE